MQSIHSQFGVLVVDYVEKVIKEKSVIDETWIGFVHNAPHHPSVISELYGEYHNFDLTKMVASDVWRENLKNCIGLFCLSETNAVFLREHVSVPVNVVYHATEIPQKKFNHDQFLANPEKKLVMIGHWMRNFQAIFDLETSYKKCILRGVGKAFHYDRIETVFNTNSSVSYIERLTDDEYDRLLSENLVFLNLFGSSANNTVIECIARETPVVVNKLPALEEYLGHDYPLFYNTLEEASQVASDTDRVRLAHRCLKQRVDIVRPERFLESIESSEIYRKTPVIGVI
jgi:hypothetical protein